MIISKTHIKRLQQLAGVIKENINTDINEDNLSEINVNDIELPKNYIHDHLNKNIWVNDGELKQEIIEKLNEIAKDFYEYLEIKVPIEDIWFIGSLTNYNWTNSSDIDLHVLIDYTKFDEDENFVANYLFDRKTIWNDKHNIKIKGFDVELYAQNSNEMPKSSGIYSVKNNKWIKKPTLEKPEVDKDDVKNKIKNIIDKIEEIEVETDPEKTYKKGESLKDKIKKMRQSGLEKSGEFSSENLAFKFLRNNGYLDKLFNIITNSYDKNMSITEAEENATQEYDENKNFILADEVLSLIDNQKNNIELQTKVYEFPFYELKEIPMSTLNTNEFPTNQQLVNDYVEKIKINPDYTPIIFNPEKNSIIDGMHRVKALEKLGYDSVRAYVGVKNINNQNNMQINENIRNIIRKDLNEFFDSNGFHASINDWINKWRDKGIDVNTINYGNDVNLENNKKENIISEDTIEGGKADKRNACDFDSRELEIGIAVESEHSNDKEKCQEIAMDHLEENPIYYKEAIEKGIVDEKKAIEIYKKYYGTEKLNKEDNLEEKFASKSQQRYFYAMANKPGKKGNEFKKMSKEFSEKTNFKKLPEKVNEENMFYKSPIQHKLFLEKNIQNEHKDKLDIIKDFIQLCNIENEIGEPTIVYLRGTRKGSALKTTASYNTGNHHVHVYCKGRHVVDILRSIAHELMHMKQNLDGRLHDSSGDDGSEHENEAHSFAGLMIRKFGKEKPAIYENYKNNKKLI